MSRTLYKITDTIIKRFDAVSLFISNANVLLDKYWSEDINQVFFGIKDEETYTRPRIEKTDSDFWLLTNFGKKLKTFKDLSMTNCEILLRDVYILESVLNIAKLIINQNWQIVEYTDDICMSIKGTYHPCLKKTVVKNDVVLKKDENRMTIITGPNAGGKSTLIKSLVLNVFFSQTFGIATGNTTMSPFNYINTQISIPDCKGKESLFEAEMYRCKNNLETIAGFKKGDKAFIVMDEIFNSTNPIEGISGAYAVAKKMSENENALIVLTTHYAYLTKLAKTSKAISNYKMNVKITNAKIDFPYVLQKGISKQNIALELLERNGFSKDILDIAKTIRDKFCV
jgi:DNA mismatch repair ATPase MutS